jgi:hypothetical protein
VATLLIDYDLRKPGKDYVQLIAAIRAFDWCHHLKSAWMIRADLTAEQLATALRAHIDENDGLMVIDLTRHTAHWYGISADAAAWIQANW